MEAIRDSNASENSLYGMAPCHQHNLQVKMNFIYQPFYMINRSAAVYKCFDCGRCDMFIKIDELMKKGHCWNVLGGKVMHDQLQ